MDSQLKRTITATVLCLVVLFGWFKIQQVIHPPAPVKVSEETSTTTPENPPLAQNNNTSSSSSATSGPTLSAAPANTAAEVKSTKYGAVDAPSSQIVTLGDDRQNNKKTGFTNPYEFAADISSIGAGVDSIRLSRYRHNVAKNPKDPDHDPYVLVKPVHDPRDSDKSYISFVTEEIRLVKEKINVPLANTVWAIEKSADDKGETATLRTTIKSGDAEVLRLTKTYRLEKGQHNLKIAMAIENVSKEHHKATVIQRGPIGMSNEDARMERFALSALMDNDGRVAKLEKAQRTAILKTDDREVELFPGDNHTLWAAVCNKYFACIAVPVPMTAEKPYPLYLSKVVAKAMIDTPDWNDDLTFDAFFDPGKELAPGQSVAFNIDTYCGPKSEKIFDTVPEAMPRHYSLIMSVDRSACTFEVITRVMLFLLTMAYTVVRNYGIAIIVLVIIVRLALHPITKRGQIHMMKMQKNMQTLKPKLDLIQQQYKNDRQKLNEETMKLYREEGINPAGQMFGCLPIFLQMPIWVALWSTLNTNVDLRHAPFFGYIRDLSSPDALIAFATPYHVPILGWAIHSFNLLPIILTITMYAQQKVTQKLTKPTTPVAPKLDAEGKPLPDAMAQQQKMMSYMMVLMGVMFYNFPSGLCIYILSSNLLGMAEQYYIRKHIKDKDSRGDFDRKKNPREPGMFARWLAPKIEGLQKKAEEARMMQSQRPHGERKKKPKGPRY